MSLNLDQFGKHVVDQFGRYMCTGLPSRTSGWQRT